MIRGKQIQADDEPRYLSSSYVLHRELIWDVRACVRNKFTLFLDIVFAYVPEEGGACSIVCLSLLLWLGSKATATVSRKP